MNTNLIQKAGELIAKRTGTTAPVGSEPFCVLAQLDLDGSPTAAAVTASTSDGIRQLMFGTSLDSNKAVRIRKEPRASVCFCEGEYNITLVGTMEIVTDPQVRKDNWYEGLSHHFSGPEDENFCVLRFTTGRYALLIDGQYEAGTL